MPYIEALGENARLPAVARITAHVRLRLSRGELLEAARRVAAWLADRGVASGDRVVLQAPGGPLWVAGFFGCLLRGAVAVPLDPALPPSQVRPLAVRVDPRAGLAEGRQAPVAGIPWLDLNELRPRQGLTAGTHGEEAAHHAPRLPPPAGPACRRNHEHDPKPGDHVEIVFTSGTTGRPRAVPITHLNLLASLHPIERGWRKRRHWVDRIRPRLLCMVPPSHLFGQVVGVLIPILMGLPVIFLDDLRPQVIRRTLRRERVAAAIAVPRLLKLVRDDLLRDGSAATAPGDSDAPLWRRIWAARRLHRHLGWRFMGWISGGAALDEDVDEFWDRRGYVVVQGYGLTEAAPIISVSHPFTRRRGTVGKPMGDQEIRIAEDGELWVRGANVTSGYLDDSQANREAFQDGWLRTGDRVEQDERGVLRVRARLKDIIVAADGLNVDPRAVEREIEKEEGVREAAVVAAAGPTGEVVHAVMVLDGRSPPLEIIRRANSRLDPGSRVKTFSVWPQAALPRTSTGKLQRALVRSAVAASAGSDRGAEDAGSTAEAGSGSREPAGDAIGAGTRSADPVTAALSALTGRAADELKGTAELDRDLALGSLDRVELLVHLEEMTGHSLDETAVVTARTVDDLTRAMSVPPAPPLPMPRWSRRLVPRLVRSLARNFLVAPVFHVLFRLSVSGREHLQGLAPPFLIVANHESHLDTGALLFALPRRLRSHLAVAMATDHLPGAFQDQRAGSFWQQLAYRGLVLLFHAYPLARAGGFSVTLEYTGELAESGYCPLIYPEGRMRQAGEGPPAFRDGPSLLARDLRIPVVPVGLAGAGTALPSGQGWPRPGRLWVVFGAPLTVAMEEEQEPGRFTQRLEQEVRRLVSCAQKAKR
ncbi:MAG: AMP-binding protein [Acidobacteria bacterium]|nr:AMP-binding protein [Acidobacteriota bacterium]